jgi:hypothetical protein
MIGWRIRPDGTRELLDTDDGSIVEIPHDHEICPNSAFPIACRQAFFAQYLSTSRSDWLRFEALRYVAAIHDILSMRDGVPAEAARLLDKAVDSLTDTALKLVPARVMHDMARRAADVTTPNIVDGIDLTSSGHAEAADGQAGA